MKSGKKRLLSIEDAASFCKFRISSFFALKSATSLITRTQSNALQAALDSGYYSTPKKITNEELASKLGTSPSNLAEHIRKARSKLIPAFWEFVRKL